MLVWQNYIPINVYIYISEYMNKLDKIENVNILAKTIQYALCNASSELHKKKELIPIFHQNSADQT
jgi:hypothetical protein